MRVTLIQSEIETGIKMYLNSILNIQPGTRIEIEMAATRGNTGFTATVDITLGSVITVADLQAAQIADMMQPLSDPTPPPVQPSPPAPLPSVFGKRNFVRPPFENVATKETTYVDPEIQEETAPPNEEPVEPVAAPTGLTVVGGQESDPPAEHVPEVKDTSSAPKSLFKGLRKPS
jgi:hypothetical protein